MSTQRMDDDMYAPTHIYTCMHPMIWGALLHLTGVIFVATYMYFHLHVLPMGPALHVSDWLIIDRSLKPLAVGTAKLNLALLIYGHGK
ncbi:hypothetical protein DL93DRAFT_1700129 [Clavulina sp. PMI_390]|nr:hypothetical protein DL93DRAFT_1700129 [Clavulina sp. PMI_390]